MSIVKKFKLHFFQITIKKDFLFNDSKKEPIIFLTENLNKTSKPENVYEINGYKAFVKHIRGSFYCFEKHRIDDLPSVGSVNENLERTLELSEGETLIEKNYFYINIESKYIVYQERQEGFRISSLSTYFQYLLNISSNNILEIEQIAQKGSYERLLKYGYVKSLELSLASPSNSLLKELGVSINDRVLYKKDKKLNLSLKVALEKKESIENSFLAFFKGIKERYSEEITMLKIKGSEHLDDKLGDINLVKDVLEVEAVVKVKQNHIDENGMISELKRASDIYHEEIKGILYD
jgi:hypothetical protein